MMNIIVDENIPLLADVLNELGNVAIAKGREIDNSMLRNSNCDAIFVR